jgi:ABC-type bacteriocin/lantibiotic exporter with double-glycine peptidase domain
VLRKQRAQHCFRAFLLAYLVLPCACAAAELTVEERSRTLCGPLCLAFCAEWLGAPADVTDVARRAGTDGDGTTLAGLARAADQMGLEARSCRLRAEHLGRLSSRTPAILHVDGDHYVVVWASGTGLTVVEPPRAFGLESLADVCARWDGAALVVSRPGEQPFGLLEPGAVVAVIPGALLGLVFLLVTRRSDSREPNV